MLLTIYNLPPNTRYQDIKSLIKAKCGLTELILDNLSLHTLNSKKVTVGLPEEEDAAILVRKINGLYLEGYHLLVEPVKKKVTNTNDNMFKNQVMSSLSASSCNMGNNMQPNEDASSMSNNQLGLRLQPALHQPALQQPALQQPALQQPYYQQAGYNVNYQLGFPPNNMQQNQSMPFSYGEPNNQNVFANYGFPQQMASQSPSQLMSQPFNNYKHEAPLGFGQQRSSNVWLTNNNQNSSDNASAVNNFSQQRNSRWDASDNNTSRSNLDAPSRDRDRDRDRERDRDRDRDRQRNSSSNSYSRDKTARGQVRMRRPPPDPRDFVRKVRNNRGGERDFRRRVTPERDHSRNDRNNRHRDSPNKPAHSFNASAKPSPWQPEIYGKHVTEPSFSLNDPKVPRPSRRRERADPKPAIKHVFKEQTEPPAKRPRNEASTNLSLFEEKKSKLLKKSPEQIPARAVTWRSQLASLFAREILNNPKNTTDLNPKLVLFELKAVIRSRLASLVGTKYDMCMNDMSALYKAHYKTKNDRELFIKVTRDIKKLKSIYTPVDADEVKPATSEQADVKQPAAVDVKKDLEAPPLIDESEPVSIAEGAENAEKYKSLFKDEHTIITQLDQDLSKAINEELNEMCEQIMEEFNDEPEATYKKMHEEIKSAALTTLKQVIKVNIAKRFLNIQPVVMRIFVTPKIISKGKLAPILEAKGITNLVKTSNSYIGTCSSYDELDRLCTMKSIVVDGATIVMKPYHLTGKKEKADKDAIKKQRKAIADSFTNFALHQQRQLENAQGSMQADEVNEQSREHANDRNADWKTEASSCEESTVPVTTNSAEVTKNYSETKQNNNQNADRSQNVDQDNTSDANGEQETVTEEENNKVEDSNDLLEDDNSQVDENNSQENENPSETPKTDPVEPKINENIVKTEKIKQETENSKEVNTVQTVNNKQVSIPEKANQIKQEPLNESVQMAEDSDGSIDINGKGDLDQAMESEDIDNLNRDDYDDIDMADLNEDDLEDW